MPVVIEKPETVSPAELFAEFNDIANRSAFILAIDDETLHDWFLRQVGWWGGHAAKLLHVNRNMYDPGDQPSLRWRELDVRIENARQAISTLQTKQHVLCCRLHGVQGVTSDDWEGVIGQEVDDLLPHYAALADRGVFDGDWTGWERGCERCLQPLIKAEALRRFHGLSWATKGERE